MNQSQRVLVAGTGISGIAAAKLVLERGGDVVLYDGNAALKEEDIKEKFDRGAKVNVVLGEIKRSDLLGVELCIISPGIPLDSPFVAVVDDAKIPILGEIELAYQCGLGKLAAITGTNGKTTTTALTGEILKARYEETFVVGNIGDPYTSKVLEMTEDSVTVAEVSSFQLETIMDFKPNVSAILNITPDHLNRHGTMENYIRIKECITLNQTKEDAVVLNYDDSVLREFGQNPELKPRVIWFSGRETLKDGFCMDGDNIVYCRNGRQTVVVNVHDMQLLGRHNYENAMAAAAIGGGLADLLTAPMWAPATIIIKMMITLPFTSKDGRILCTRNIAAPFVSAVLSAIGYYLADGILFGSFVSPLVSFAGSAVQSGGSAIIFLALAVVLDRAHMKARTQKMLHTGGQI